MRLRGLLGALAAALLLVLVAPPAPAHAEDDYLVGSDPQPRQELNDTPGWVTLAFKSKASAKLAKIIVLDAKGTNVTSGALIVEGTNVTTQLSFDLPKGTYSVYYRTSGTDGKPRGGAFQFAYGKGEWTALDKEVWVGEAEEPPIMSNPDPNASVPGVPSASTTESATTQPSESADATAAAVTSPTDAPSGESGSSPAGWLIAAGLVAAGLLGWAAVLFVRRKRSPAAGGTNSSGGDPGEFGA
ncbi:copper resistance CopC family protein [Micropruina sp.]|uniref:copper resistance CopC family protein n=1 Tax=Micropruina sp. TaxID=2737536 RepID=UPI0039E3932D